MIVRAGFAHTGSALSLALGLSAAGCGVGNDKAEIYAFRARITTGSEGSDGDVSLCWTAEGRAEECKGLSSDSNDFEANTSRSYDARPEERILEGVVVTSIRLRYSGGLGFGAMASARNLRQQAVCTWWPPSSGKGLPAVRRRAAATTSKMNMTRRT